MLIINYHIFQIVKLLIFFYWRSQYIQISYFNAESIKELYKFGSNKISKNQRDRDGSLIERARIYLSSK